MAEQGGKPKTERVLTVHDVAEEYGVKPKTVYRWLGRKKIRCTGSSSPAATGGFAENIWRLGNDASTQAC